MTTIDLLSEILRSARLEGSVFFRSHLTAPWGIELPAGDEPRFHVVLDGRAWLHSSKMERPQLLKAGTAVVLRDGEDHWIADDPQSRRVSSAEASTAQQRGEALFQGPRSDCHLLCGLFKFDRELRHPLLETLPSLSVLSGEHGAGLEWIGQTGALMATEMAEGRPGNAVMMDRLCELFLIQILRHLSHFEGQTAGFIAALDDRYISRALQLIHQRPAEPWDLASLASAAGLSRSAFANRFHTLVGVPPKAYLTMWRMQKARALMRNPYNLLNYIAKEVGYSSDVALIRAFQRHFGKSPKEMRRELAEEQAAA